MGTGPLLGETPRISPAERVIDPRRPWRAGLMRRLLLCLLAAGLAACASSAPASPATSRASVASSAPTLPTHEISGSLSINVQSVDDYDHVRADKCEGAGRFADLQVGGEIEVRDATETLIGLGRLEAGTMDWDELACQMPFGPISVPQSPFYSLTFGQHAGPVLSDAELQAADWTVDVSVGEPLEP